MSINNEKEIFEWVRLKEEIGSEEIKVESGIEKFQRKFLENPFVPIGATVTFGCLTYGLYSFRRGNKRMSQLMMRARVVAQGFTAIALVGGIYVAAYREEQAKNKNESVNRST